MDVTAWLAANRSEWTQETHQGRLMGAFGSVTGHIALVLFALSIWWLHRSKWFIDRQEKTEPAQKPPTEIKPLEDFDLNSSEPRTYRPFKPKYHLTMGLETLHPSDLLIFDKTYQERIALRASLIQQYPEDVIGITNDSDDRVRGAVQELYGYLFTAYLPSRYPALFKPSTDKSGSILSLQNLVTKESIPANPEKLSLRTGLETISQNIDEDFFILLPHKSDEHTDSTDVVYVLEAYSACFPSGFQPREKLGKRLADIHGPVPGYKTKLQKSMDRFFARLEAGKLVRRVNWSLTVDEELFSNFDKSKPAFEGTLKRLELEDLDLDKTFLRCERQTLHRMPISGAIVFAFHTYLYPIEDVKADGSGEDLAMAIDGLTAGSVPEIFTYKNGDKWADAVRQYLRS